MLAAVIAYSFKNAKCRNVIKNIVQNRFRSPVHAEIVLSVVQEAQSLQITQCNVLSVYI